MGESISASISAASGSTAISMIIRGKISPGCLEDLKLLVKIWARECGLEIDGASFKLKKLPKPPKKLPKRLAKKAKK